MDGQNFLRGPFYNAKAGLFDHISPERLQFTYIAKQNYLTLVLGGQYCTAVYGQNDRFLKLLTLLIILHATNRKSNSHIAIGPIYSGEIIA